MLVPWGTETAERERLECFSACTNDAKGNLCHVLGRAERSVKGTEIVRPDVGLWKVESKYMIVT